MRRRTFIVAIIAALVGFFWLNGAARAGAGTLWPAVGVIEAPESPAAPNVTSPALPADPSELHFKPDVHPTPRLAMAALAQDVIADLAALPAIADPNTVIIVRGAI